MSSMTLTCAVCDKPMGRGKTSAPQGIARHRACTPKHGASGYRRGCRCEVCREGQRANINEYNRERKERDGVAATTQYVRKSKGLDPLASVNCTVCEAPLGRVRAGRVASPMHKACRPGSNFHVHPDVRRLVFERDDWTCKICDFPVEPDSHCLSSWYPTLDHIIPRSIALIEDNLPDALRTAHRYCNLARGARPIEEDFMTRERAIAKR